IEEAGGVGGLLQRFGADEAPHDRLLPIRRIGQVDFELRRRDLAAAGGQRSGKRRAETHVSLVGELIELNRVQHERKLDPV
ncbi:MAG: hypothetical protein QOG50_683, partial [Actinomycetota bacterium]|nr:hypothetical protein [Actinomycetota bacterium]